MTQLPDILRTARPVAPPQLRERVLAVIAPKKIDLVIDSIGGTLLNQVVSMLGECVPSTEVWLKLVPTSDVP